MRAVMERHPATAQSAEQKPPMFERVTDVLGPLEHIVVAADQEIGSIQERVESELNRNHGLTQVARERGVEARPQRGLTAQHGDGDAGIAP